MKPSVKLVMTVFMTLSALIILFTGTAHAGTLNISGTIDATDPQLPVVTISAPNCMNQGTTLVRYDTYPIQVDVAGDYTITVIKTSGRLVSMYVHTPTFDPVNPRTNCLAADNTIPVTLTLTLAANTVYHVTAFDDTFTQLGATYDLTISGPGTPTLIEPDPTPTLTPTPTSTPTLIPTDVPTDLPTAVPTDAPTLVPSATATITQTPRPTEEQCRNPLPVGSVQGRMTETVLAYYNPNPDATTNIVIAGGTSWWIIGSSSGYYRIWITCQASPVWVPAAFMAPNYDNAWNGQALPDADPQNVTPTPSSDNSPSSGDV